MNTGAEFMKSSGFHDVNHRIGVRLNGKMSILGRYCKACQGQVHFQYTIQYHAGLHNGPCMMFLSICRSGRANMAEWYQTRPLFEGGDSFETTKSGIAHSALDAPGAINSFRYRRPS